MLYFDSALLSLALCFEYSQPYSYIVCYAPINVNPVGGGGGVRARGGDLMPETVPLSGV